MREVLKKKGVNDIPDYEINPTEFAFKIRRKPVNSFGELEVESFAKQGRVNYASALGPRQIAVFNIPKSVTKDELSHVFSDAGKIQSIKFKNNLEDKKSYAIIDFLQETSVEKAVEKLKDQWLGTSKLKVVSQ